MSVENKDEAETTPKRLKYRAQIEALAPPKEFWEDYAECNNRKCVRVVFNPISDIKNFYPGCYDPKTESVKEDASDLHVGSWALSFFDKSNNAKKSMARMYKSKPNIYKKLGNCIAEGVLIAEDGLAKIKCSGSGHFNHFEYAGTDFYKNRFEIVETIIELT